jgi:hypothetical protein
LAEKKRNANRLFVGKTTRKTKTYWVDNIKMDFGEIGWGSVDWIGLPEDRDK